jgi:hypothetical protein
VFRRIVVVVAGVLIGLSGAATSAHAAPVKPQGVTVTGDESCNHDTGVRTVTWAVTNSHLADVTVHDLHAEPTAVPDLDGAVIPHRPAGQDFGRRVFSQTVPARNDATSATVSFTATGQGVSDTDNTDTVPFWDPCEAPRKPCVKAADATFTHTFAAGPRLATATVTLDDDVDLCDAEPVTLVTYYAPRPRFATPQYVLDHQTATISNANRAITLGATVPDCDNQVDLFFGGEADVMGEITADGPRHGDAKLGSARGPGARSKGPQGWSNGGAKGCTQPAVEPVSQCDGSVDLALSNTGEPSRYPVEFTVSAGGDFEKTVTVAVGAGATVHVPAGRGRITVTADGNPIRTYTWARPADCPPPAVTVANDCASVTVTVTNPPGVVPAVADITYGSAESGLTVAAGESAKAVFPAGSATSVKVTFWNLGLEPLIAQLAKVDCPPPGGGSTGGEGGGLPVTGAAAGTLAAGAAALLIAGVTLFLAARRRRISSPHSQRARQGGAVRPVG